MLASNNMKGFTKTNILVYNNQEPENVTEKLFLPREEKKGRIRKPLSDDNEV